MGAELTRERPPAYRPVRPRWAGRRDVLGGGRASENYEREADALAEAVTGSPSYAPSRQASGCRGCPGSETGPSAPASPTTGPLVTAATRSPARPLPTAVREQLENGLGHDLGRVRIHSGPEARRATSHLRARAFTVGPDIVLKEPLGDAPPRGAGGRVIAHEAVHTLQQARGAGGPQLMPDDAPGESPAPVAPVAASFDVVAVKKALTEQADAYKKSGTTADRLALVRTLKLVLRGADAKQQAEARSVLDGGLGADRAAALWAEAATPLGGYSGMYPSFAPDLSRRLTGLGVSEQATLQSFELSASGTTHKARAKAVAAGEVAELGRTDILYFRGHQFAQYRAPGLFSNGDESRGFDLRYVEKVGGFPNVKLIISTSCATLCQEAFSVMHGLFPNAVILGYRKSAPLDGAAVRDVFQAKIKDLARPLLLDQPLDVAAIVSAWRSTVESKHAGQPSPSAGYYDGGDVNYWDGKAWQKVAPTDAANACYRKGDFRGQYPGP